MSEEPGESDPLPTMSSSSSSTACLEVVNFESSFFAAASASPEDADDCFDGMGNLTAGVLDLLNIRLCPREPNDPDYRGATFLPSEARIYAAEYCRLQEMVDKLTQKIKELEETRDSERQAQGSNEDMEQLKEKLNEITEENKEHQNKLSEAQKVKEELRSEAEGIKVQLSERETELEETKIMLITADSELKNEKDKTEKLQEIVKTKDVLEEHHVKLISDLNGQVEEVQQKLSKQKADLEICQYQNKQFILQIDSVKEDNRLLSKALKDNQISTDDQRKELELEVLKCTQFKSDLDMWQQKAKDMEAQMEELKQKVARDEKTFRQTLDEHCKSKEDLNQKVKMLDDTISMQKEELEKEIQLRSQCKNDLTKLMEENKKFLEEEISQEKDRLKESIAVNEGLNQRVKTLEGTILELQGQLQQSNENLECERKMKERVTTKHEKLRNLLSCLSSEILELVQHQSPATEKDSMSPQARLKLLTEATTKKFLSCLEDRILTRNELEKMQKVMMSLDKILKSKPSRAMSAAASQKQKEITRTPSPVVVSSTTKASPCTSWGFARPVTPAQQAQFMSPVATPVAPAPTSIISARLSYRDTVLRSMQNVPPPAPPSNTSTVPRPLFIISPNIYKSPQPPSTPAPAVQSPSGSGPRLKEQSTPTSLPSLSTSNTNPNTIVPSHKDTKRKGQPEVRQLFTDSESSSSIVETPDISPSKVTHGIDEKRSHRGFYCLCGSAYASMPNLKTHVNYFTKSWKFLCHICQKRFFYLTYLNRHLKKTHKISNNPSKKNWRGCKECGKTFPSHKKMYLHYRTAHKIQKFKKILQGRSETSGVRSASQSVGTTHATSNVSPRGRIKRIRLKNTKTRNRSNWNIVYSSAPTPSSCENVDDDSQPSDNSIISQSEDTLRIDNSNGKTTPNRTPRKQQTQSGRDHLFSEIMSSIATSMVTTEATAQSTVTTPSKTRKSNGQGLAHEVDMTKANQGNFCICGKESPNKAALNKHVDHYNPRCHFSCPDCNLKFIGTNMLRKHMKMSHKKDYLYRGCRRCGSTFLSMLELKAHQKLTCAGVNPAEVVEDDGQPEQNMAQTSADVAVYDFSEEEKAGGKDQSGVMPVNLEKHGDDVARKEEGVFCLCGMKFPSKTKLSLHVERKKALYSEDRKFECTNCLKRFKSHAELLKHRRRVHNIILLKKRSRFGCQSCGCVFTKLAKLMQHRRSVHAGSKDIMQKSLLVRKRPVSILKVAQKLAKIAQASKALTAVKLNPGSPDKQKVSGTVYHNIDWIKYRRGQYFCCCGHQAKDKYGLKKHVQYYTDEKKFTCSVCQKGFEATHRLRLHMREKHGKTYKWAGCRVCGKLFETTSELRRHVAEDHSQKKMVIDRTSSATPAHEPSFPQEDVTFKSPKVPSRIIGRKESVKVNQLSVTKKKHSVDNAKRTLGFYCVCGTKCLDKGKLYNHIQYMNLPRKFVCKICSRRCAYLSELKKHLKTTHKLDDTKVQNLRGCSKCGNCFNSHQELVDHQKLVHSTPDKRQRIESKSSSPSKGLSIVPPAVFKPSRVLPLRSVNAIQSPSTSNTILHSIDLSKPIDDKLCKCGLQFETMGQLRDHIIEENITKQPMKKGHETVKPTSSTVQKQSAPAIVPGKRHASSRNDKDEGELVAVAAMKHKMDKNKAHLGHFCLCGLEVRSRVNLEHHIQYFANGRKFLCGLCPKVFPKIVDLNKHKKGFHHVVDKIEAHSCRTCGVIFASKPELAKHWIKILSPAKKLVNVFCPLKGIASAGDVPVDSRASTGDRTTDNINNWVTVTPSISIRIGPSSINPVDEESSNSNWNESISITPYDQENSGSSANSSSEHGVVTCNSDLGLFICKCGKQLGNKQTLNKHIRRFTAERKFICQKCGKAFLVASLLRVHLLRAHKVVQSTRSIGCTECGEFFPTNMELHYHHKIVHNLGYCDMKYSPATPMMAVSASQEFSQEVPIEVTTSSVDESLDPPHQPVAPDPLSEGGDSSHSCTCGKVYLSRSALFQHVRVKARGKIFQCSWCSLRFDTHGNLKKHVTTIHGLDYVAQKGKFACGVCAQTFSALDEVIKHRLVAHGERRGASSSKGLSAEVVAIDGEVYEI